MYLSVLETAFQGMEAAKVKNGKPYAQSPSIFIQPYSRG